MMRLLLRCLLLVLVRGALVHAGEVVIGSDFTERALGLDLELAYDPEGTATFEEVRAGKLHFAPSTHDVPSFGYRSGAEWARFSLRDLRVGRREELVLESSYAPLDVVEVFDVTREGAVHRSVAGDHVPFSAWPLDARLPAFALAETTSAVWVRVASTSSHQLPLQLRTRDAWRVHAARENVIQSLYYGALAAMVVYNALVWVAVGLRLYGYYVGFLLAFGCMSLLYGGVAYAGLLGNHTWLNEHLIAPTMLAALVGSCAFAMGLLDLGPRRPAFARAARLLTWLFVGVALATIFVPYSVGVRLVFLVAPLLFTWIFWAGAEAARRGERAGIWFLVAWSTLVVGVFVNLLRLIGFVPTNVLTTNVMQVGSAVEFLLLSFALADRIKQLQAEATANAELAAANAVAGERASALALEELQRLGKLKDEFLANTSHELRTPLNGVIGMAEALHASRELPGELRAKTVEILEASRRLSDLVGTIVDFSVDADSRPETGSSTHAPTVDVDLAGVVARAVEDHRADAATKGLAVRVALAPEVVGVRGDVRELGQVVRALLSNAIKFSNFGAIDVRARRVADTVELVIVDSGMGIEAERLASIFHAFEQGDGSAARRHGGMGLGLALAKKLVERRGGRIDLTSTVSVGTTVRVTLEASADGATLAGAFVAQPASSGDEAAAPRASVASQAPSPRPSLAPVRVPSLPPPSVLARSRREARSARLLVVDDDRLNRMVIASHLVGTPFACVEAASGAEALQLFRTSGPFDAILLDVMMPEMTGYDVCRELRRVASAADLPVLMLTAKHQVQDLIEGFDAGANDYVHKPIQKGELLARVTAHIGLARSSIAMRRFVPRETIRLLGHDDLTEIALGEATEQVLTVAFSDVRGFTTTVERVSPREAFEWLNRAFAVVGPEVRRQGGFIDKYIGDAVMALFPRSPVDALRAAVAMHHDLHRLGDVRMGTGLHVGATMLGTMGEPERFEATVLSDTVNVASRIEGASKVFGVRVLASSAVHRAAAEEFSWRSLGPVRLKGRSGAIELFELLDADPADERAKKREFLLEFDEAVRTFADGAFLAAALRFERLVDANPSDGPAYAYLLQSTRLAESPDEGFDGAFVMLDK